MLVLTVKQEDKIRIDAPGCLPVILRVIGARGKCKLGFESQDRDIAFTRLDAKKQERKQKESD